MSNPKLLAFLERLHRTGALSVPPEDLAAAVAEAVDESLAGQLRQFVAVRYLNGSPVGKRILEVADIVESYELERP